MSEEDAAVAQALCDSHRDEVLAQGCDDVGAKEARVRGNQRNAERENRKDHAAHVINEALRYGYVAQRGKPLELHADDESKQQAEHEVRNRRCREEPVRHEAVGATARAVCAEDSEGNGHREGEDLRVENQLQCLWKCATNVARNAFASATGKHDAAEIAAHKIPEPVEVVGERVAVEAELFDLTLTVFFEEAGDVELFQADGQEAQQQ